MSDRLDTLLHTIERLLVDAYWLACAQKEYDIAASLEAKMLDIARLRGYDGD